MSATEVPFAIPPKMEIHRNVIPRHVIERVRAFVTWAMGYRDPPADGQIETDWSSNLRALCDQRILGHPEALLRPFWECGIPDLCRAVLGPEIAYVADTSLVRDYNPSNRPRPAHMHFDAHIFGAQTRMLTVWIPLNDVGRDSPGLVMAKHPNWPLPHWQYLADNVDSDRGFRPKADFVRSYTHDEIFDLARQEAEWPFFEPELSVGDAFIFDHQHIHGTQTSVERPDRRMSLEIRILPVDEVTRMLRQGSSSAYVKLSRQPLTDPAS